MEQVMEDQNNRFQVLDSFQLKVIAIVSMLIDHIGAVLFPQTLELRYIGRLAFPIFCFLLTEGFHHTRSRKKYLIRLFLFALVSEVPYDLAFRHTIWTLYRQNVFFTLFIGFAMMCLAERERQIGAKIGIAILAMWAAEVMHTDYGFRGILLIAVFYMARDYRLFQYLAGAFWNFLGKTPIQYAGAFAMLPIALYNGEKGWSMKYFFYVFYPVHLTILYLIWRCVK